MYYYKLYMHIAGEYMLVIVIWIYISSCHHDVFASATIKI